ncbi:hypothetical protein [Ensifer sp. LCM 4579]|uniref:hypothetical protein n=1 Tax=Ensifer sp. LCM 4579 TaxID=1848292 RepID=UPI0008DA212C|nr:hypothetical protein [Ensifer sp. LCM 4579]OHV80291.1 hypothetical protein LCM4579_22120 [Ensifer sp. LCM 4579]
MKPSTALTASLIAAGSLWAAAPAQAEDASWGCQVLLCAASSNPSWQGVPYCVPPMKRLIAAMARPGFDWPICHEAKAGAPGREEYEECPAGFRVGYTESGNHDDFNRNREPNRCVQTMNRCENRAEFQRLYGNDAANQRAGISVSFSTANSAALTAHRSDGCMVQVSTHRPRRANPYYFDIPNDQGVKQRFWFNLND